MKLLFVTTALLFFLGANEAGRKRLHIPYDILSTSAKGWETIAKATNILKLSRVFPSDRNLMKRIALVESSLNRTSTEGGLWNVGTCAFWGVTQNREKYGKRLKKIQKMVGRRFGISWTRMTYDQLQRPMYSLIAARMYLYIILTDGIPRGATAQSKVWSNYYRNCGESKITVRKRLTKRFKKVVRGSCYSSYKKCDHHCVEVTVGRGECRCKSQFKLDTDGKSCKAILYRNPCTLNNGKVCEHSCLRVPNTVICTCPDGHYLHNNRYKCIDVNECSMSPCQHECHNTPGSYYCSCFPGYSLEYDQKTCKADRSNDCISSNDPSCITRCLRRDNMQGQCVCPPGMALHNDNESCIESNGCLTSEGFCHHSCVRTAAGFSCACKTGFMLDSNSVTCTDIDECSIGEHNCDKGCLNVPGSYHCSCPLGFKLNKDGHTCSDIDECLLKTDLCKSPAKCRNTEGDYRCECPTGYQLNSTNECVDMNECLLNNGGCEQTCLNVPGSCQCGCHSGYRLSNDMKTCQDIDECTDFPTICGHNCTNTPGGYKCTCPPGTRSIDNGGLCL
ncbi:signal peptide, CUB and EGF-like domain-containing 2 [Paramuricea clavata]|uniref:Signal peptide, CUB and EGF-like domain-containing 2 n=1 Tax=Paramuricea clavata TaxID=317549 RepID=A0A7D9IG67_PARCT|nr:signal peptide, CUB and EGF-like domain-containing 2 [Paramuricea clavata]